MEKVTLTNMCMVEDKQGNVGVLNRIDEDWGGYTFPGGHVECGESFTKAVIREVWEETGLTISCPQLCGLKQWPCEDGRYVVFLYRASQFEGTLKGSEEGEVFWLPLQQLRGEKLADGFESLLQVFLDDKLSEQFCTERDGIWMYKNL